MQHVRALFKQKSFEKKVDILDIIREVVRVLKEDPKKRDAPIALQFEATFPAIFIDPIQIQQVFMNLILNTTEALEGSLASTQIILRAQVIDSDEMLIQVIDNGPGVNDLERVFDAFMTKRRKAWGLAWLCRAPLLKRTEAGSWQRRTKLAVNF